jgi:hypothetical protein
MAKKLDGNFGNVKSFRSFAFEFKEKQSERQD